MEGIIALLIPLAFVCIPIVAIVARHKEKIRRMEIEAGMGNQTAGENLQNGIVRTGNGGSDERAHALEERLAALEDTVSDMSSEMDKLTRHLEFNERLIQSMADSGQQAPAGPGSSGKGHVSSPSASMEIEAGS